MKVLHIITDLSAGGAEAILYRLIRATCHDITHRVVSLHGDGVYGPQLRAIGVATEALGMPRSAVTVAGLRRLAQTITEFEPDVIQTRLYHADLVGGLLARFAGSSPVAWAVHSTDLGPMRSTWKTRAIRRCCAVFSHMLPAVVVCDADGTKQLHMSLGYDRGKLEVIPNGVDLAAYERSDAGRKRLREAWNVAPGEIVLGCMARWDPLKDHANLLGALSILARKQITFRCVLAGSGMTEDNAALQTLIRDAGLEDRVMLLGPRNDVADVLNAIDIHVLASYSESLPVAVIEAMACGTPCVVTNVGDCATLVGETGWVVPARDSNALAAGIESAIAKLRTSGKEALGRPCRARVEGRYTLEKMVEAYRRLWSRLEAQGRQARVTTSGAR